MNAETKHGGAVDVLAVMDRARDVLAETYAKYQTKIGPFASQSQQSNVELRQARAAVAELIEALRSAEGLAACCMSVDGYSRKELEDMGRSMLPLYRAALARVGGAK